jgi:hypothetical protein
MNLLFEIIVFFFPLIICTSQSMLSNKDNTLLSPHMTNHDPTIPAPYVSLQAYDVINHHNSEYIDSRKTIEGRDIS